MKKIAILVFVSIAFNSCQVGRFIVYNFANITDYKIFPARTIEKGENSFTFHAADTEKSPKTIDGVSFDEYLEKNKTVAFLIIRNDTILSEKYFKGYDQESIVASFSMAKSVTSILLGCAIDDGFIESEEEHVTKYIPELNGRGFDNLKIKHLLQMTSGIEFNESYVNPFGHAASFYYGTNLRKQISKLKPNVEPGKRFAYSSGDTQVLGLVLERALKSKSLSEYLQEKLWIPLEMEYDASWSLDREKEGLEKTFCCINARARDFAKIGRLYKNNGNWNGKQIISAEWVHKSTQVDTSEGAVDYYQYQWWLPTPGTDFMAEGILGQYVYVHPKKDLIIVRLGKNYGKAPWNSIFKSLAEIY